MGFKKIVVESDCKNLKELLNGESTNLLNISLVLLEIKQILQSLAEASRAENGRVTDDYREDGATGKRSRGSQPRGADSLPTFIGKHRLQAAISQLNNEINIIQDELEQLKTMGESSSVCKELISSVESISDPLLPWINGSVDGSWDRWFGGAHHSRSHKRWI
ncbi:uncharacterized protein LOC129302066 [Prosopis cineraria]|uniref:uncharacterized protein LOC129302066 n=1 Tax=Prosopis cineraria TaxID=364024 RepID=UPI002410A3EA|nr:uncharacterized protein LOC129302066 [Prosopis cineraria]